MDKIDSCKKTNKNGIRWQDKKFKRSTSNPFFWFDVSEREAIIEIDTFHKFM